MGWREEIVHEVKEGLHLVRRGQLDAPREGAVVRRAFHGGALVVGIARAMWNHAPTRDRYLRVVGLQVLAVVVLSIVFGPAWDALPDQLVHVTGEGGRIEFNKGEGSVGFWGVMYTTYCVVEWIIIALSRDFHDELSDRASLLVGVPPEGAPAEPRLRLSVGWCFRKLKRRVQGMMIFGLGLVPLAVLRLVPEIGDGLYAVAAGLWGFYLVAAFTLGKTAYAWKQAQPVDPWFFRAWERLRSATALLRWWLPEAFLAAWRRFTGAAARPASLVERIPFEALGLALVRVLGGLPVLYLFIRPVIPVAATFALQQHGLLAPPGRTATAVTS